MEQYLEHIHRSKNLKTKLNSCSKCHLTLLNAFLKGTIRKALEYIVPERLMIAPDCGLGLLPPKILHEKLTNMAQAVKNIRGELWMKSIAVNSIMDCSSDEHSNALVYFMSNGVKFILLHVKWYDVKFPALFLAFGEPFNFFTYAYINNQWLVVLPLVH